LPGVPPNRKRGPAFAVVDDEQGDIAAFEEEVDEAGPEVLVQDVSTVTDSEQDGQPGDESAAKDAEAAKVVGIGRDTARAELYMIIRHK
jgi:hypothetical protein